jgi:hypothetical protein
VVPEGRPGRGRRRADGLLRQADDVEDLFHDGKNKRNGWSLRDTPLEKTSQLGRLLLVPALAYWLLVGVGLVAKQRYRPGRWCSSSDPGQCSDFTIGKVMLEGMQVSADQAFAAVLAATIDTLGKLGTTQLEVRLQTA